MAQVTLAPISLEVPNNWTAASFGLAGAPEQIGSGNDVTVFRPSIAVTTEAVPAHVKPAVFLSAKLKELKGMQVYRKQVAATESVTLGGREAAVHHYIAQVPEMPDVHQMAVATTHDGVGYLFTLTHLAGEPFEKHREVFDGIVASITVG
jgi:hypothetical protein